MVAGTSKLASFPVSLPTQPLPKDVTPSQVAYNFQDALSRITTDSAFIQDAVWRDTFCFTGTLRTLYSASNIAKALQDTFIQSAAPIEGSLQILSDAAQIISTPMGNEWVEVVGSFKTKTSRGLVGECTLMMGVVWESKVWKIWSLRTILDDIEGWHSVDQPPSQPDPDGTSIHFDGSGENFTRSHPTYFETVIVGGGQSGLSVAGRLQALGVKYVLIDKYERIGDSWGTRYESFRLHTIREYAYLPFDRTFPKSQYPTYMSKDDLARGYQDWTRKYGIDKHIWTNTEMKGGIWDQDEQRWTIEVLKDGHTQSVHCRFVVMATGPGGQFPSMPSLPGCDKYRGLVLHSKDYVSSKAWAGKSGIVVGTANTAHDVADDMYEAGLSKVTMVQRSKTYVLPYEYWEKFSSRTYNEKFPTELADKLQMTGPMAVGRLIMKGALDIMANAEPERFENLARAGFETEKNGDLMWHLVERAGGHYMDVGTSKKIADGKIQVKSNATATHYTPNGLGFGDGTEIPADIIVWSTGFDFDLCGSIRKMFGAEVAGKIDGFFGVDDEGEVKGTWKLQHPGLLTHGIAQGQSRFMSKYIALQIKAVLVGKAFEVYDQTLELRAILPETNDSWINGTRESTKPSKHSQI